MVLSKSTDGNANGNHELTKAKVEAAQKEWGEGIVAISATFEEGGNGHVERAKQHIDTLYAYGEKGVHVMFKPTLAAEKQFRDTFEGALSYFVGTPGTEDGGFAIQGWTNVRWESNGIHIGSDSAMAMGNYYFTGPDGNETKVEYSFGYIVGVEGMPDDEAAELIRDLYLWQTREEFQYTHRWAENMLVLWDNRSVLHKANGGYDGYDRELHRTTISPDRSLYLAA